MPYLWQTSITSWGSFTVTLLIFVEFFTGEDPVSFFYFFPGKEFQPLSYLEVVVLIYGPHDDRRLLDWLDQVGVAGYKEQGEGRDDGEADEQAADEGEGPVEDAEYSSAYMEVVVDPSCYVVSSKQEKEKDGDRSCLRNWD